jgi:circadian clock protein KaiB
MTTRHWADATPSDGVIDVRQQPALAARDQIVAAPTLVKRLPGPARRIVGDLSDAAQLRLRLELGSPAACDGRPDPDE